MVARIRVQVEKVSSLVRSWIYCEGRADGSPQGTFWLEMLGEWCSCLLKGRMRGEELAESGLECIKYESIQGEISSRQLDIPVWSSGKRSKVEM